MFFTHIFFSIFGIYVFEIFIGAFAATFGLATVFVLVLQL
jgi:hypothetical protein